MYLILIILVLCLGGLPELSLHQYGYAPSGVLGAVLVVLVILLLLGYL